jgi:hypothetical protein
MKPVMLIEAGEMAVSYSEQYDIHLPIQGTS